MNNTEIDRKNYFDFRPKSTKGSRQRPKSSSFRKFPSISTMNASVTEFSILSTKPTSKYQIENEALYEQTMQLKIVINNLKKELKSVQEENSQKELILSRKDREINDMIEKSRDDSKGSENTELLKKINEQIEIVEKDISEMQNKNDILRQNLKITKMNELTIEQEILNDELEKINSLYNYSLAINEGNADMQEEFDNLKKNCEKQKIIYESLLQKLNEAKELENDLLTQINDLNEASQKRQKETRKVHSEVISLQSKNENLNKDEIINPKKDTVTEFEYSQKIATVKKDIKYYKSLRKAAEENLKEAKETNKKNKEILKQKDEQYEFFQNKKFLGKNNKIVTTNQNKIEDETEKINALKEKLQKSKIAEANLENELRSYQERIEHIITSQEQN